MEEEKKQIKIIVTGFLILSLIAFLLTLSDGKLTGNVSFDQCAQYMKQLENPGRFGVKPLFGEEYWFTHNCLRYFEKRERPVVSGEQEEFIAHEESESLQNINKPPVYNILRGPGSCIVNPLINKPVGRYPYLERQTKDPYSRIISIDSLRNDLHSIRCSLFSDIPVTSSYGEEFEQKSNTYSY